VNYPAGIAGVSRHIATSSALNPALLLCAICSPICFTLSYFTDGLLRAGFFLAGITPLTIAAWQIVRFTLNDPDRLQNDRHVENKMLISRFGVRQGEVTHEVIIPPSGEQGPNPLAEDDE